jgi:nucleoside-diphosphate-sugar epimerase
MPAVPAYAKVLVTGASGFIAIWVVKILLERGYSVVGTGMYMRHFCCYLSTYLIFQYALHPRENT